MLVLSINISRLRRWQSILSVFRQPHHKLRKLPFLRFHFNLSAMLLHNDVVADRQTQARALSRWLRRKERIENFLANLRRNAVAVVADSNLPRPFIPKKFYLQLIHKSTNFYLIHKKTR